MILSCFYFSIVHIWWQHTNNLLMNASSSWELVTIIINLHRNTGVEQSLRIPSRPFILWLIVPRPSQGLNALPTQDQPSRAGRARLCALSVSPSCLPALHLIINSRQISQEQPPSQVSPNSSFVLSLSVANGNLFCSAIDLAWLWNENKHTFLAYRRWGETYHETCI